jgi:hypothetical protein
MRRLKPLALLAVLLQAPSVDAAESACSLAMFQWELELTRVERESGDADVNEIIRALGTRARLRGGYRDPAHPKYAPRAELVGSTDGDGMSVLAEKREP